MFSLGKIRHHAAERRVGFHLRGDDVGENLEARRSFPRGLNDRDRRFVAARFDGENAHPAEHTGIIAAFQSFWYSIAIQGEETGPHRLEAQDTSFSSSVHGFESHWGRQARITCTRSLKESPRDSDDVV